MPQRRKVGSRQPDLLLRSKTSTISLPDNHPMVVLTDAVDWTEMEARAERIREKKLKNTAGRPPRLRATLGALTLMALRSRPYREVEEQIRYYAPARYLCGLTESDWTPDFTTVHDLAQLLGEEGIKLINEAVVEQAVQLGLADPRTAVADTTAQEAAIPHPNEMGLLGGFVRSIEAAAVRTGRTIKGFVAKVGRKLKAAKEQVRRYRLFAKSKAAKDRGVAKMTNLIAQINGQLGKALQAASAQASVLKGYAKVARRKLEQLHRTVGKLLPQIRYWLRTGYVAAARSSTCTSRSCTRSCAARWARPSSSACPGASPGSREGSSWRWSRATRRSCTTPDSRSEPSRISRPSSARRRVRTPTTAAATARGMSSGSGSSEFATWDWPPWGARAGGSVATRSNGSSRSGRWSKDPSGRSRDSNTASTVRRRARPP
jgi:molybdopterin converting factor small subunit